MMPAMTPEAAQEIKQESARIAEDWPGVTPLMRQMMEFWPTGRPKLWASLMKHRMAEDFARVMEEKVHVRREELQAQGSLEANSRAHLEILADLLEPEEEAV